MSALSCDLGRQAALPTVDGGPPALAHHAGAADVALPASETRDAEFRAVLATLERYRTGLARFEEEALAEAIITQARRHQVTPSLVLAVMHVESRYNNFAVSPVGALGLMQVMPQTGAEVASWLGIRYVGPQSLFDPETNVAIGVAYLKWLLDRYHDLPTALAAYNWGPQRISSRLRRGVPLPTDYPRLVLDSYAKRTIDRS
ncbi:MAG: lytic transglycosylase domain-containing protein [Deltaproteobacteria bacterium]|nr:MAG: lytic transglycosylase domain-containing protein [Deltaproteobacteria bacterium]